MTRGYSNTAMDHFNRPRNVGRLASAHARGTEGVSGAGNYMVIELFVEAGRIAQIRFQTYGCPGAICCGSMITELARGKTPEEADAVTPEHVLDALGGLPLGKHSCARLAVGALRAAIQDGRRSGTIVLLAPRPPA